MSNCLSENVTMKEFQSYDALSTSSPHTCTVQGSFYYNYLQKNSLIYERYRQLHIFMLVKEILVAVVL